MTALTPVSTEHALTVSTAKLNDAIHDHVVVCAQTHGSRTAAAVRYVHFNNASAKAIGLPKSDAAVIAALPVADQAMLALLRHGVATRIPHWVTIVEAEGGDKPHNKVLVLAKQWMAVEVAAMRACGLETLITRITQEIPAP